MDNTRRIYLDNIRWITVCIVVIYHVIYMYNGVQLFGVIGPFKEQQLQDAFQYLVYPWMMALLYTVSGMTVRYYMEKHNLKEFIRDKTRKLLVPSTVGLFVFQWILGYYNMKISGAFESFESVPGIVRYVIMAISGIGVLWYIQVLWIFSMLLLSYSAEYRSLRRFQPTHHRYSVRLLKSEGCDWYRMHSPQRLLRYFLR